MQKFKASLRFLGILFLRVLLGIVVAYLWAYAVAYLFHIIMDVRVPRDVIDHFYDTGPPREGRYGGTVGSAYGFAWRFGIVGFWVFIGIGIIWGFSQGRLDCRRWLRKQHA
ncbi:hypothetical protein C6503_17595 [Candidatus Poribacteria bacterium]|nr:MAG: hypothetical protein C6503_17595 [Candidatus Poribacteria bacterium]